MARWRLALGALILFAVAAPAAWAVLPTDTPDHRGEVPLPQSTIAPAYRQMAADEAVSAIPGWASFVQSEGAGWIVAQYRDDLEAPSALFGPGIELLDGYASDAELAEAARRYAAEKASLLHADPGGLGAAEVVFLGDLKRFVILQQVYQGLEVVGGRVDLAFDGGKLVFMGSSFYPGVGVSTRPGLDAAAAQSAAIEGVGFSSATDRFEGDPRLVVYPIVLETGPAYFLAWEVKFRTQDPVGDWWAYVDAADGEILARTNHAAHFDIPTTVTSDIQPNYSTDPQVETPSPDHKVMVNAANFYTDENGFVNLSVPLNQTYTVTAGINGRWSTVVRMDGSNASFSGPGTPGVPLSIHWTDANSHVAERDAYYSVNRIHKWIKAVDPTWTLMDWIVTTRVNITSGTCNAYWDGSSVNFYKEGGGCVNMATISDVVMHEYGHGITQRTYSPQAPPTSSGMGEAFSDMCAQTVTNDRYIGKGYAGGSTYIRDAENLRQYPGTECGGQVHCLGEILMGASWKTRKNFISTYGYGTGVSLYDDRMRRAWKTKQTTMPAYLTQMLVADDDNANLADGTPNWYEICNAYAIHNLPCPAITQFIFFQFTPVADLETPDTPIPVTCYIEPQNCGSLVPDSTRVVYSLDQGQTWSSLLMSPTGNPYEFSANIPGQPCGTLVTYYISARTTTGVRGTEPIRAPGINVHRFMVGSQTYAIDDNLEADQGWTIGAPGDGATQGIWQRADPVGKSNGGQMYQPENDHTPAPGVNCFVTDPTGGYYLNGDVDGGATTVLSPIMDFTTTSGGVCRLDFWAFFQNDITVDDTLRASVSNDAGATWHDLVKIFGKHTWNNWNNFYAYFTSDEVPFTNQMRFRFQVADYNNSCTEAAVDDIWVSFTACGGIDSVEENAVVPARFVVEPSRPNPTARGAAIRFGLTRTEPVRIDLFDAGGRLVRTVLEQSLPAGYHTVTWDGQDGLGHAVASGTYWYRVSTAAESRTRRLLVVR